MITHNSKKKKENFIDGFKPILLGQLWNFSADTCVCLIYIYIYIYIGITETN